MTIREEIKETIDNIIFKDYIEYNVENDTMKVISTEVQEYYKKTIKLIEACTDNQDIKLMKDIESLNYTKKDMLIILGFIDIGLFNVFKDEYEEYFEEFIDIIDFYLSYKEF